MPSPRTDLEYLNLQVPREMKRALEELVLEYRRRRKHEPRTVSSAVRLAIDKLLQRDLAGYTPTVTDVGALRDAAADAAP